MAHPQFALKLTQPGFQERHIYDVYKTLRDDYPVCRDPDTDHWVLSRYDDVRAAFRDNARMTGAGTRHDVLPQMLFTEGDLHKTLRGASAPMLVMEAIAALEPEVRRIIGEVFDEVEAKGDGVDLMRDIAYPIPHRFVMPLLGYPEEDRGRVCEWVDNLVRFDENLGPERFQALAVYITQELLPKKLGKSAGDDLFSRIVRLEKEGEIGEGGAQLIITTLVFASMDTTIHLLANGTELLARHPDQRAELARHPEHIDEAIDEMLRLESPAQVMPRRVTAEVEYHGVTLEPGAQMLLLIGAANRDERHYPEPDKCDLRRGAKDHLGFGFGVHLCLGRHLARMEGRVYFTELLKRFPDFRIGATERIVSHWARAFSKAEFFAS